MYISTLTVDNGLFSGRDSGITSQLSIFLILTSSDLPGIEITRETCDRVVSEI